MKSPVDLADPRKSVAPLNWKLLKVNLKFVLKVFFIKFTPNFITVEEENGLNDTEDDEVVPIKIRRKGRPKRKVISDSENEIEPEIEEIKEKPGKRPRRSKRSIDYEDDEEDDEPLTKVRRHDRSDRRASKRKSHDLDDEGERRASRSKKSLDNNRRSSSRRSTVDVVFDSSALYTLLDEISKNKHSWAFERPVSVRDVPDYYDVVKKPMDFAKIKSKLNMGKYTSNAQMMSDVELIFFNCDLYNTASSEIYR